MKTIQKLVIGLLLAVSLATAATAQITVPNTLVAGTTIKSTDLNTNFSTIANHALDRLSGGNLAGNVTADALVTIDGLDLSAALCATCGATFKELTLATPAVGITVAGVNIVNATGKVPALTASYFTSVAFDAVNLTGSVDPARLGSGTPSATTFLQGDSTWVALPKPTVNAQVGTYTAVANDMVLATGTFTVTLPTAVGNANVVIDIKNVSTGVVTVEGDGAETIDGAANYALVVQYQSITVISDGAAWWIK
jgi:hypothetical protein